MSTRYLGPLLQLLNEQLDAEALSILCFDLGIDEDALPPEHRARALLDLAASEDRIYELVNQGKALYPGIAWDAAIAAWSQARVKDDLERWRERRDQEDRDRHARRARQRVVNVRPFSAQAFRDRVDEARRLQAYLADGSVRLVSVVGRGGMGKTALVSHVLEAWERALPASASAGLGLPPALHGRLRAALLACEPFGSDEALRARFAEARLVPWRDRLPEAGSPEARVVQTIDFLFRRSGRDAQGRETNALLLLLRALTEGLDPGDSLRRQLTELARELDALARGAAEPEAGAAPEALPVVDGILYLSARSTGLSLERVYTDVGRMLGDPAASRLAARWADRNTSLAAKVEYLLESLRDGVYLILLDNVEDVLDERHAIAEEALRLFVTRCLLQQGGGARLLITSREQVALDPAALVAARTVSLREGLPESESVALLRALDPEGRLGLQDAPASLLRRAAQVTRGIPWALERLVGILDGDLVSLPELLRDRRLLDERVLEETFLRLGYEGLAAEDRRVLEALAVFNRPVHVTAVAFLLQPWYPALDVRACLRRLVRRYFVTYHRASGTYSLHPLDRDYVYQHIPV